MKRKRLLWQLFPSYLLIVVCVLLAAAWYDAQFMRQFFINHTSQDLLNQARLIQPQFEKSLESNDQAVLQSLCERLGKESGTRITFILPSGEVLADSQQDPGKMENHARRDEVAQALRDGFGQASRYSHTLNQEMMYVAIPVRSDGAISGILRTSLPLLSVRKPLRHLYLQILFAALVIAGFAAVVSLFVSRRISRPLEELKRGALLFANGDLSRKLLIPETEEIGGLAQAMNDMAQQLDERISAVLRQQNEQTAILSSMIEGVLAIDVNEKMISINNAAARMLQVNPEQIKGLSIQEAIRNTGLHQFVARTLSQTQSVETEIALHDGSGRFLLANGAILTDSLNKAIGAVVVLNDITRLRKLENMRREFVANVSHELRTPLTSIQGFIETLIDGGLDDRTEAENFLAIIGRHVDRLNVIIEDLLLLSTLEHGSERSEIVLENSPICQSLQNAVDLCAAKASEKHVTLKLVCDDSLQLSVNLPLLEQAVVNLIDNAVKYSEESGIVEVTAELENGEVLIRVSDSGCGISSEHLPRLFERFYRVDKARSRKLGGTGLGLAIVKHIALAHGGQVSVKSTPGKGSEFSIHLPLK